MRKLLLLFALIATQVLAAKIQAETYYMIGSFSNYDEMVGDSIEYNLSKGKHTFGVQIGGSNTILGYSAMDHEASQKNYWATGNYIQFDMCSAGKVKIKMVNGKIVLTGDYAPRGATVCSVFGGTLLNVMGMDPNKDFADMTLQEDGTWVYEKKNLYLTAAKHEYFVVFDHQMMFQFPNTGRPSFKIGKEGYYTLKFIYDPEAATLTHEVTEQSAADAEAALFLEGNLVALNAIVQGSKSHTFGKFHEATGTNFSDTVRVQKDKTVTIYPNTDYIIQSITVDGQALEVDANGLYTFVPQADSRIKVQATEVEDITVYLLFNAQTSSTISANISGLSSIVLEQGTNELTFKGNRELTLKMNSWGGSCLVRMKEYADVLTLSQSVSLSELNQGDTIYIETVTYSNVTFEGTVDALVAIEHSKRGWQEITDPMLPISVINGIPVSLSFNSSYTIRKVTVNGEALDNIYSFIPSGDSKVNINARLNGKINVKLIIDDVDMLGFRFEYGESFDLHSGENDLSIYSYSSIEVSSFEMPYVLTKNGDVINSFLNGQYWFHNLEDGDVIELHKCVNVLHETADENTAVVIIDNASLFDVCYVFENDYPLYFDPQNGTQYWNIGEYNVWRNKYEINSITLNHEPQEKIEDHYQFSLSHGDTLVIRTAYDNEHSTLTFSGQTNMLKSIYENSWYEEQSLEGLTTAQVKTGNYTTVYCLDDEYALDSVLVNGMKVTDTELNSFSFYPVKDSEVKIFASPVKEISVTIRINDPSMFNFSISGMNNAEPLDLQVGDNIVKLMSSYGISVSDYSYRGKAVILNGAYRSAFWGDGVIDQLHDGDVIEVLLYDEWNANGIETICADIKSKAQKCLIDGKLVILRNGRKYDLTGKEVQ